MFIRYIVKIEKFAESHYIKKFSKKYNNFWDKTLKGIILELERFDNYKEKTSISSFKSIHIFKIEFRVAGTNSSKKNSGNRYIISLDKAKNEIKILLVYHKNDIGNRNETATWKKIIRNNYNDYNFLK